MAKPIHIVLTTINFPTVVRSIRDNARIHGHLDQTKIWIVGDVKTPKEVAALAIEVTETGLETVYLDLPAQDAMSGVFGSFVARLPLNNECRRNLGYLAALQDGCEILLAMDDDNFPVEEDLIGGHLQTGRGWAGDVLTDPSGYYNV